MTIRQRLVILVLIALCPALLVQGINELELRRAREREAAEEAMRLSEFAAGELDRFLDNGRTLLAALAASAAVQRQEAEACIRYVSALNAATDQFSVIGAISLDGTAFCASADPRATNVSDRNYFRWAIERQAFVIGEYTIGRLRPVPVLPLAAPFYDEQGALAGVVFAALRLDWLAEHLGGRKLTSATATLLVADRNGTILARMPDHQTWVGKTLAAQYQPFVTASAPGTADIVGIDGIRRILAYVPVYHKPAGLYVGVALTRDAVFASIDAASVRSALLILIGALCSIAAALLFARRSIVEPIARLQTVASEWTHGNLGVRSGLRGSDEFTILGRAFDDMADRVQAATEDLQRRVEHETKARVESETRLFQFEKLDALGNLAGGIAHDFNNILQVMMGSLERLRNRAAGDPAAKASFRDADIGLQALEKAKTLVSHMLAFARRQPHAPEPIDAGRLLRDLSGLLRRGLRENIAIETVVGAGTWTVTVDRLQLETALINLAVNAGDAMPDGGRLTIETANCFLDENYAAAQSDGLRAGQYVAFQVSDTGSGMAPDVAAKAFDPFFTTKPPGQGTGLGLSQVYGFAKQSGGHVKIYSEPGQGTTVKLYLPRSGDAAVTSPWADEAVVPSGDGARVLVVEDDPGVRAYTVETLRDCGYGVIGASHGPEALEALDRHQDIALLVTDVGLPEGMNGRQLAEEALRRRPSLKVLFVTGYARNAIVHGGRLDPGVQLLVKPFTVAELAKGVARAMGTSFGRAP